MFTPISFAVYRKDLELNFNILVVGVSNEHDLYSTNPTTQMKPILANPLGHLHSCPLSNGYAA
jgi:hypothetical protein